MGSAARGAMPHVKPVPRCESCAAAQLQRAERVHSLRAEFLAGAQRRGRERGLVRRIREVLSLEAEGVAALVRAARLSDERAVEEVGAVELHSGLGRADLEDAPGSGL